MNGCRKHGRKVEVQHRCNQIYAQVSMQFSSTTHMYDWPTCIGQSTAAPCFQTSQKGECTLGPASRFPKLSGVADRANDCRQSLPFSDSDNQHALTPPTHAQ